MEEKRIKLISLGGGYGFVEILQLVLALNEKCGYEKYEIIGILDDDEKLKDNHVCGYPVLGPLHSWNSLPIEIRFVFCIGSFTTRILRKDILEKLKIPSERFCSLIHPNADLMIPNSSIGCGVIIHNGVLVYPLSVIGNFVTISGNCVIGVKNFVGSYSLFAANVSSATDITYGAGTFVGTGSILAPNLNLGAGSQVGVGSVVFRDIDVGHKVLGNPARAYGKDEVQKEFLAASTTEIEYFKTLT